MINGDNGVYLQAIQLTQPDVVMVELCTSRVGILQLDEAKLLEEAKNINFEKFRTLVKQVRKFGMDLLQYSTVHLCTPDIKIYLEIMMIYHDQ